MSGLRLLPLVVVLVLVVPTARRTASGEHARPTDEDGRGRNPRGDRTNATTTKEEESPCRERRLSKSETPRRSCREEGGGAMPAGGADADIADADIAGDAAGVARTRMGGEACGSSSWTVQLVLYIL